MVVRAVSQAFAAALQSRARNDRQQHWAAGRARAAPIPVRLLLAGWRRPRRRHYAAPVGRSLAALLTPCWLQLGLRRCAVAHAVRQRASCGMPTPPAGAGYTRIHGWHLSRAMIGAARHPPPSFVFCSVTWRRLAGGGNAGGRPARQISISQLSLKPCSLAADFLYPISQ